MKHLNYSLLVCAVGAMMLCSCNTRQAAINNLRSFNTELQAEANFYDDPEAAEIVLTSGARCLICPIEPCEEGATYTKEDLADIGKCNNPISDFLVEELQGYIDRCNILFNTDIDSCCVYDYAAVAPLIDESVITEKRKDIVRVDISGGMADGQMVIDRRGMFNDDSKTEVIYHVDAKKLHEILLQELSQFRA